MEDDDEIHSHPASPVSGSPPRPNGRITVTVAAAPPAQGSNSGGGGSHNSLALALVPIQQHAPPRNGGSGGGGGGREDCWSEEATAVLIEAWGERYMELSRGNLKQKHWKEVADIVCGRDDYGKTPKTDIQCKNRIDTVKKKYKLERAKMAAGGGPSKWRFYDRLDHLIGPAAAKSTPPSAGIHHHKAVPMGIPVGIRPISQYHPPQGVMVQKLLNPNPNLAPNSNPNSKQKMQFRRRGPADSDSSRSLDNNSPDSTDSFPPESYKRPRIHPNFNLNSDSRPKSKPATRTGEDKDWGNSMKELSRAILKFGEVYEQAESSKLEQMVEIEKQRMKFAKEMELQRMQFFMKTQLEISQLKHHHESRIGMKKMMKKNNHHSNVINNNNNSDSSN